MKIRQIVELCIKEGIPVDPRGQKGIDALLKKRKEQYEKLEKDEKPFYDKEKLTNPYDDTRILVDDGKDIKTVLVGIDMEMGELFLASELNRQGKKIDAIWSHHPEGVALMGLDNVMRLQVDTLAAAGVPVNQAEALMTERIKEVSEALSPANPERIGQAAKLLKLNFFNTHTPADNHAYDFFTKLFEKKKPETLGEIVKIIREVPEYKLAMDQKIGPMILVGSEDSSCGKIYVDMTGGTESSKDVYKKLADKGIGTIVGMHVGKEMKKAAEKEHMNVVIAGHISSDTLGLNLLFDEIEKEGALEFVPASGFERIRRTSG